MRTPLLLFDVLPLMPLAALHAVDVSPRYFDLQGNRSALSQCEKCG